MYVEEAAARLELSIDFAVSRSATAKFNGSAGIGDLIDISTVGNATLDVTVEFNVSTVLAVIFEPNSEEELVLIGNACGKEDNSTFSCGLEETQFKLTIIDNGYGGDLPQTFLLNLTGSNGDTNASASAQLITALEELPLELQPIVREVGANVLTITFNSTTSAVELIALKDCTEPGNTSAVLGTDMLICPTGQSSVNIFNSYGLSDDMPAKRPFQIAMGNSSIIASFVITGDVILAANVGGVIEVEADLHAQFGGSLTLHLGTDEFLTFPKWLAALISIFHEKSEGYIKEFFTPTASFEGDFTAEVEALAPFNFGSIDATGAFDEAFEIDFFELKNTPGLPRKVPNISFEVDLPNIGGVRNLSFAQVVELLAQVLEFLIGAGADDTPTSCSGGLLGKEIGDQPVFSYQVPSKWSGCRAEF